MFDGKYFDWNQKRIKGIVDYFGYKFFYNKKILDLGCGHADLSGVLYRLGADITAVDARQEHLKTVTKKFPGVKVVRANLEGPWPFFGQKFDIILDLGLLCHLGSFEEHLKTVCASTNYLILETAVCDSNDPNKCITVPESKDIYDLSFNGMGCRPSAAAIEAALEKNGMFYKRMDNSKFNSGDYVYDWFPKNDDSIDLSKRRLWFASKDTSIVISTQGSSQPAVFVQAPPASPSFAFSNPSIIHAPHSTATPRIPNHYYTANTAINYNRELIKSNSKKFAIMPGKPIPQFPDLKVLYLPLNDGPNIQKGMYDAWANVGVNLQIFDYNFHFKQHHNRQKLQLELIDAVRKFQPQLIHMQLQFTGLIEPRTLVECRKLSPGVVITNWSGDVRNHAVNEFVSIASSVDYSLISSVGQLELYKNAGCSNVKYWQIGYDAKSNFPMDKHDFRYDVSFIGNNYGHTFPDGPLRYSVANELYHQFRGRFGLFGHGYTGINNGATCSYQEVNNVYNNSACVFSISNYNNVSYYFSDRLLHCLASGRPTISWYFPGCEDYFEPNTEIFYARTSREVVDIVRSCVGNPEMANKIGLAGFNKVSQEHTYTSRVLELIDMIFPEQNSDNSNKIINI